MGTGIKGGRLPLVDLRDLPDDSRPGFNSSGGEVGVVVGVVAADCPLGAGRRDGGAVGARKIESSRIEIES